jgi:hypothetical protein
VAKMADWKQAALSIFCTTQKQNSQKTVSQWDFLNQKPELRHCTGRNHGHSATTSLQATWSQMEIDTHQNNGGTLCVKNKNQGGQWILTQLHQPQAHPRRAQVGANGDNHELDNVGILRGKAQAHVQEGTANAEPGNKLEVSATSATWKLPQGKWKVDPELAPVGSKPGVNWRVRSSLDPGN